MQAPVRRHDELLRQAIEAHNGYVFKTAGDAFCAAFDTVGEEHAALTEDQLADLMAVDGLGTGTNKTPRLVAKRECLAKAPRRILPERGPTDDTLKQRSPQLSLAGGWTWASLVVGRSLLLSSRSRS